MDKDFKSLKYKINLDYEELLEIKTSLLYVRKCLSDRDEKIKDYLIILHDKIQKQMLNIIQKSK